MVPAQKNRCPIPRTRPHVPQRRDRCADWPCDKHRRAHGDQYVGPQTSRALPVLTLKANHTSQNEGGRQADEGVEHARSLKLLRACVRGLELLALSRLDGLLAERGLIPSFQTESRCVIDG